MNKSNFTKFYTEPKEKYNIVSTVIFRLKNNYKPFIEYYNGLKFLVDNLPSILPDFYLRLYYDDTISIPNSTNEKVNEEIKTLWMPYFEQLKQLKYVQLCKYNHKLNEGLFGTLVRFYPLFDYTDNANIEIVIISDVDISNTKTQTQTFPNVIKYMNENNTDIHYLGASCYLATERFEMFDAEGLDGLILDLHSNLNLN